MLKLMYITNECSKAKEAEKAGVDRIFIDLEINGKKERQGHLDTLISDHSINDIKEIHKCISKSEILVRSNPLYENSKEEIDKIIEAGADIIMLPMFKNQNEVRDFISIVNGRAKVCLLLETSEALARIDSILELNGIDEIHIGLNDLHLALGVDFMFELLSDGIVEYLSEKIRAKNIDFGFGGIAKIGFGDVPSELVIAEHYRMGSQMAILSRLFSNSNCVIEEEVRKIREFESGISKLDLNQNKTVLAQKIRAVAMKKRGKC